MPLPYENAAAGNAVADAYWEIVESYKAENAELRAAWAKVRAEIEARSRCGDSTLAEALAILAQHAPKEG